MLYFSLGLRCSQHTNVMQISYNNASSLSILFVFIEIFFYVNTLSVGLSGTITYWQQKTNPRDTWPLSNVIRVMDSSSNQKVPENQPTLIWEKLFKIGCHRAVISRSPNLSAVCFGSKKVAGYPDWPSAEVSKMWKRVAKNLNLKWPHLYCFFFQFQQLLLNWLMKNTES